MNEFKGLFTGLFAVSLQDRNSMQFDALIWKYIWWNSNKVFQSFKQSNLKWYLIIYTLLTLQKSHIQNKKYSQFHTFRANKISQNKWDKS